MEHKTLVVGILVMILVSVNLSSIAVNTEKTIDDISDDYNVLSQYVKTNIRPSRGWVENQILSASDGGYWDRFGFSVSIDGDYAIIGAPFDHNSGEATGSAYVFKYNGTSWNEEQKLVASDGEEDDWFGISVIIDNDNILIGAYADDNGRGSAYVFKYNGTSWNEEQKLTASNGETYDKFGESVFIDDDNVLIGATRFGAGGFTIGSAYVFKYNGTSWNEEQELFASDGEEFNNFGESVSIDGDNALIGAPKDDNFYNDSGAAYVFKYNGTSWNEEQKLVASDGDRIDNFAKSVSISGTNILIGAFADDNGRGSAYVFKYNGTSWNEEQKLVASDGEEDDRFGCSVSIDGDNALIGARHNDEGSAYVFKYDGISWTGEQKLMASNGEYLDNFGWSVCIDGGNIIIGAPAYLSYKGSAYMFVFENLTIPDLNCNGNINWNDVTPGETVLDIFTVQNIGGPGTMLNWEIESYPDWGDWTFIPDSGTGLTPENGLFEIEVSIVTPDDKNEEFTGEIIIVNNDDPSDTCNIDVSLATPISQSIQEIFVQILFERFPNAFPMLGYLLGLYTKIYITGND